MMNYKRRVAGFLTLAAGMFALHAASSQITEPELPLHTIEFDTDEGTFMNVDVSPDENTLVFDLLGDLYTLPITGGAAKPLLEGRAWDHCPRYSPDGNRIAFISDRVGGQNIWTLDLRTHELHQVTHLHPHQYTESAAGTPSWLPGGSEISFGKVEDAKGGMRIASVVNGELRELEPDWKPTGPGAFYVVSASFTPDGQRAFFSETLAVNGNPQGVPSAQTKLYALDLATRQRTLLTEAVSNRSEFKPQVSASGRWLAYGRRNGPGDIELRVRDLRTNIDRRLIPLTGADEPYRYEEGVDEIPAFAFTPDDQFIVISYGGKLHKVSVWDGSDSLIPFTVHVIRQVVKPAQPHYRIPDGPLQVRAIRWPSVSKDGKRLLFSAVGYLWQMNPNGQPTRLTHGDDFEYMPVLSPDGGRIAYVDFPRAGSGVEPGQLTVLKFGETKSRRVTSDHAMYYLPSWSPDGSKVAVIRQIGEKDGAKAAFGWIDVANGSFHEVAPSPVEMSFGNPESYSRLVGFSGDGRRIFFSWSKDRSHSILAIAKLDGTDMHELAEGDADVRGILPSPDLSEAILIGWDEEAYLTSLSSDFRKPVHLTILHDGTKRVSKVGAYFPVWQGDHAFTYGWSNHVYRYDTERDECNLVQQVDLRVSRREGSEIVVFRGARLITVAGDQGAGPVIEHGSVVVEGRRIVAVGPLDSVVVPPGARIFDATGMTILPGLIDVHYHSIGIRLSAGITPPSPSMYYENRTAIGDQTAIVYGVTTAWDALGGDNDGPLAVAELRETGRLPGPRWFFAGRPVGYPFQQIDSYATGLDAALKRRELGVEQVLKEYHTPDRERDQWFAESARQLGLGISSHVLGGLTQILQRAADGFGLEHVSFPIPLYRDVQQFLVRTGVIWTTASLNLMGAADTNSPSEEAVEKSLFAEVRRRGEEQESKLERFAKAYVDRPSLDVVPLVPVEQTRAPRTAAVMADFLHAGGKVALSAHNWPAILTHFEMWTFQHGGVTPGEAIRAATLTGAEKLGIQEDVGSLAPGKIADFLVLTSNPLDKIESSLDLKYTVADGIIYNSDTAEIVQPESIATKH